MVITFREDELERIITAKDIEIVNLKKKCMIFRKDCIITLLIGAGQNEVYKYGI